MYKFQYVKVNLWVIGRWMSNFENLSSRSSLLKAEKVLCCVFEIEAEEVSNVDYWQNFFDYRRCLQEIETKLLLLCTSTALVGGIGKFI